MDIPLADKLRPESLDDYVGQEHLVGKNSPLRVAIDNKLKFSFILWGPPGVGKTTLARIYAKSLGAEFFNLSAVSASKDDIKKILNSNIEIRNNIETQNSKAKVIFLDEIHRFNKAQQDFLLPYVENGALILIGATTENPSFEVISPLLSRCRVFVMQELRIEDLLKIGAKVQGTGFKVQKGALDYVAELANGDARQFINLIEVTHQLYGEINEKNINQALQSKHLRYDKLGEEHFNTISAFIKSMRASDADAALYYLARMVDAGEDPLFIARRMVVFASEDIGMAVPTALVVANAVFRACETIGFPECQENLAAGVVYLAQCKKDRSAYDGYMAALSDVKTLGNLPIPMNIRNAPTKLMKEIGYGKGYDLPASATLKALQAGKYTKESLLPEKLKGKKYFRN